MNDTQALYDLAPMLEVMALGLVIALGPLAWVWWRSRGSTPVSWNDTAPRGSL